MEYVSKLSLGLRLIASNPSEFYARAATFTEVRWDRLRSRPSTVVPVDVEPMLSSLRGYLPSLTPKISTETDAIQQEIAQRVRQLRGPFTAAHNADTALATICYQVCRALKPEVVVETGVANGVTSFWILHALAANRGGALWSIDLPPLAKGADTHVGSLVPGELRDRWILKRGRSQFVLPMLLKEIGPVDLFIHDSLHTYRNMRAEFRTVWPYLKDGGVVIADDVEGNRSFEDFVKKVQPSYSAVVCEKHKNSSCFGIMVK